VAAFEPRSLANGPGLRAVLWVQGCGKRCPGCFNPEFQQRAGGREVAVEEVLQWIADAQGIEGVTFSGGEPFDQAEALAAVARGAQARGLGVVVFTGYERGELEVESGERKVESRKWKVDSGGGPSVECRDSGGDGLSTFHFPLSTAPVRALIAASDLIVAGPYERERSVRHALLASANQELVFVTERYRDAVVGLRRRVEFRIGGGEVRVTGFPWSEREVESGK
jgi:anaerobic ribonucleoside-triphosphate reductase activating protein